MDRNEQTLSLIGLCLRGRNLEVGEEPVEAVARARDARVLLLASDAADNTARRVRRFAEMGQCVWLRVPFTKRELGLATGRASAAVAAITDIGLAVAVVRRLAEAEPEKYDEDLAKLELKAKRAAERKSEAAQHEKNLRRGVSARKSRRRHRRSESRTAAPEQRRSAALEKVKKPGRAAHAERPPQDLCRVKKTSGGAAHTKRAPEEKRRGAPPPAKRRRAAAASGKAGPGRSKATVPRQSGIHLHTAAR